MHAHHFTGMLDQNVEPCNIILCKLKAKALAVTHQGDRDTVLPDGRNDPFNFNCRGIVAPHYINRNSHIEPVIMSG